MEHVYCYFKLWGRSHGDNCCCRWAVMAPETHLLKNRVWTLYLTSDTTASTAHNSSDIAKRQTQLFDDQKATLASRTVHLVRRHRCYPVRAIWCPQPYSLYLLTYFTENKEESNWLLVLKASVSSMRNSPKRPCLGPPKPKWHDGQRRINEAGNV